MSDDIYNAAIMARARAAQGAGRLSKPDVTLTLDNPLCGDRVTIDLKMEVGRIADLAHKVRGCTLCEAAASVIGENAVGQSPGQVREAIAAVRALLDHEPRTPAEPWQEISIFAPVRGVKSRHECVLLPFEALDRALTAAASR